MELAFEQPGEIYEPLYIYQCQVEIGRNLMKKKASSIIFFSFYESA